MRRGAWWATVHGVTKNKPLGSYDQATEHHGHKRTDKEQETEKKRQFPNTGARERDNFTALPSKGNLATWMKPSNSK